MTIESLAGAAIELALGNLAIALPLGLLAWSLQRQGAYPQLAHLIWLVVLVKLVTPPLYSLRIDAGPAVPVAATGPQDRSAVAAAAMPAAETGWLAGLDWQIVAVGVWLAGSVVALVWCLTRARRFQRLLCAASEPAPPSCRRIASELAAQVGIGRTPAVMATAAGIAPMVWWIGGRARIYLPRSMIRGMPAAELRDVLAHELGHVARGDHYVRGLECLVGMLLWWNPVAWWVRRNLRVCEEICCDAFVLARTGASRDAYAGALVSAIELLTAPTLRPSGMASHVNGGFIERRIEMILSGKTALETPRWLRGLVLASAALLLPIGFTLAQDPDAAADDLAKVREWLESGVNSAFLTQEQADIMLGALRAAERGAMTMIDDDGNFVVHRPPEGGVVFRAESIRLDPETNRFDAEGATIGRAESVRELNLDPELGELVDGRRVVKVEVLGVEAGSGSGGQLRVVRQFDDATTETEIIETEPGFIERGAAE